MGRFYLYPISSGRHGVGGLLCLIILMGKALHGAGFSIQVTPVSKVVNPARSNATPSLHPSLALRTDSRIGRRSFYGVVLGEEGNSL